MASLIVGGLIGSGAYGNVYHGEWEGRKVAIKKFSVSRDEVCQAAAIQQEVDMLKLLTDQHIIQFYGTAYHDGMLVIIMNYAEGGSLQQAIDARRLVDWRTKTRISQEIVRGLAHIHHKNVLHRDLKSMNVLLTRHMEAKLCDFGLATIKTRSASKSTNSLKGTFRWMAPELFTGRPKYSTKSDMYALGMVMWEMAANTSVPFREQSDNFAVVVAIKSGEREILPDDTPADYRMWVERCWDPDPDKRPEAVDMITTDDDQVVMHDCCGHLDTVSVSIDLSRLTIAPFSSNSTMEHHSSNELPLAARDDNGGRSSSSNNSSSNTSSGAGGRAQEVSALLASANNNDVEAQVTLAAMYEEGKGGVAQDDSEAFRWYLRAAALESTQAQYKIGDLFYYGRGTPKNYNLAAYWMRLAAERGHPVAQNDVGWMYQSGLGVDQDYGQALAWFQKSAEQGYASAQNNLGWMYRNGLGVQRDYSEAVSWYRQAAEQGDASAQNNLGWMYQKGFGVGRNYSEAAAWYLKSAQQEEAPAQFHLGCMYKNGFGVRRDYGEAISWYRRAALHGHAKAQYNLAWMYQNGRGAPKDIWQAIHWYRKAADQGDADAKFRLQALDQPRESLRSDSIN